MAAISVTILPDASLETNAKVSSHLKMTVPASWIQKKRPMRKLLDAALKQWQLADRSYALRRKDGTALDLDASLGTLEEGAKLVVGVAAAAPVAPPKPQTPAPPKPSKAYATLRSGARIPLCGLGTGGVPGLVGEQCVDIVSHALRSGVRLVDTASQYGNEREVGRALRKSGAPRGEVFLVTKVAPLEQGYAAATTSVVRSLERLGVDSVDLVVVHWPGAWVPEQKDWGAAQWLGGGADSGPNVARRLRRETWRALEDARRNGLAREIGVSNYTVPHLEELMTDAREPPAVVQSECSLLFSNDDVRRWCAARGVHFQAYGPMGGAAEGGDRGAVGHAALRTSRRYPERTPAQAERVVSTRADFDLAPADVARLDSISDGRPRYWDPANVDKVDIFNPFLDKARVQRELASAGYAAA
ncbi:oxidoreductase [Aureococcus anophagefferens]|nr:oxidoreductase [Aureococcus anophagefferens]